MKLKIQIDTYNHFIIASNQNTNTDANHCCLVSEFKLDDDILRAIGYLQYSCFILNGYENAVNIFFNEAMATYRKRDYDERQSYSWEYHTNAVPYRIKIERCDNEN